MTMTMATTLTLGLVVALGALGAAAHLVTTRWRAQLVVRQRVGLALALLPVGLAGPAAAVLLATRLAPHVAWATLVGIFVTRFVVLHHRRAS